MSFATSVTTQSAGAKTGVEISAAISTALWNSFLLVIGFMRLPKSDVILPLTGNKKDGEEKEKRRKVKTTVTTTNKRRLIKITSIKDMRDKKEKSHTKVWDNLIKFW